MSLDGWFKAIHEMGEQHDRERRQRVAEFDPADLPAVARQHLIGAIVTLHREFTVDGECRFVPSQLLEAMVTAVSDVQGDRFRDLLVALDVDPDGEVCLCGTGEIAGWVHPECPIAAEFGNHPHGTTRAKMLARRTTKSAGEVF